MNLIETMKELGINAKNASIKLANISSSKKNEALNNLIKDYLVNNYSVSEKEAFEISRVSKGSPGWAINAVENDEIIDGLNKIIEKIDMVIKGDLKLRFEYSDDMVERCFAY